MSALLVACFAVSGASALALEMLWMRSAALVLGATAATNAAVLACYFAGLAAGGVAASRGRDRPVRAYGRLELGVAAGAAWSLVAFAWLRGNDAQRLLVLGGPLATGAALAVATLPATTCLGATLPALGQVLARGAVGRRGGTLYALNTLGAAVGAAAAGFGLPVLVGVPTSYALSVAASAAVGLAALAVGDRLPAADEPSASGDDRPSPRLHLVAAATGALGLGLEVLWTRVFALVLHNSIYSFTAVALVFLLAIACGAALSAVCLRRVDPARIAATALVTAGATTVGGYWLFVRLTGGLDYVGMTSGLGEYVARILGLAAVTAGPAAAAGAAVLPALWQQHGARRGAATPLGRLTAANALGGALGALTAGFVVVPLLGLRGGFLVTAVAFVVLADAIRPAATRWRAASLVLLLVVVADPLRAPITHLRDATESLRATIEGPAGVVTVVDTKDDVQLRLDTFYTLGGTASAANERRQGLVPLLLHPEPRRVAFVGLATGITASMAPALAVHDTTVVELVPEVVEAARTHFRAWNGGLLDRDDVHLVVGDGRHVLAASGDRFDVVVSDLFIPWHAGTSSLYSREMYDAIASRLAPGGLFCQWLPLYQLTRNEFDVIARTFLAVFPDASVWRADFYPDRPVVALVGSIGPRPVDLARVDERLRALPEAVRDPFVTSAEALAMLDVGDLPAVADLFTTAPLNTDDRPVIEFLAPRLTRMTQAGDKDWFTGEALAAFYDTLDARSGTGMLPATDDVARARRAGLALFRYALAAARREDRVAADYEDRVRALVPDVIAEAQVGDRARPVADAGAADVALGELHREQSELRREMSELEKRLADLREAHP